ncbi:MAG: hypothetical protein IPM18_02780 [Phycisphaerales bacterium]|nr:hypothetical protein [Phycisphaerales bacterium]
MRNRQCGLGLGALALAGYLALPASAQIVFQNHPLAGEVNFSGATLFRPFFFSPATTNDAIDVDGDGFFGFNPGQPPFVDQLAAEYGGAASLGTFWAVSYRSVGSINGFGEFVDWQLCGTHAGAVPPEDGFLNRFRWASQGIKLNGPGADCLDADGFSNPDGDTGNDDGSPFCRSSVDGAAIDVPGAWAVKGPADLTQVSWNRAPTFPGYGVNPIASNTGWVSELESLDRDCSAIQLNTNYDAPDNYTIYDTAAAWGPITYIANRGIGRPDLSGNGLEGDIRMTDIQHLMVAGRLRHGENLAGSTRSSGSGTRNGIQNTSGIDPAWGRGDNLDTEWAVTNDANLGLNRKISNAQGSSGIERAVEVSRLAIGFTGLSGNERAAFDAARGRYEVLNIRFDDRGGSALGFVRPDVQAVVYNGDPSTGWQLGGTVTFVTRGNPFETDPNHPTYMTSQQAAWYLRNITQSAAAFAGDPGQPEEFNMPGEYLATVYFLTAGLEALPDITNPVNFSANPDFNPVLAAFVAANNTLDSGWPGGLRPYGDANPAGLVPRRVNKADGYADGQVAAYAYKDTTGMLRTILGNGANRLAARNEVQGDFNRDGRRNINDIRKLLEAYQAPLDFEQGQPTWPVGGDAGDQVANVVIVHVIGDFDGNGNLDAADVRYFADGLALDPAQPALDPNDPVAAQFGDWLNRPEGFRRVDQEWFNLTGNDNFFATTLATGKVYQPGDSAGDIAGSAQGATPGADPRGADGSVDAKDIDAVYRAFKNEYLGYDNTEVDWYNLDQAVFSDLSADMTGPELVNGRRTILINQADVDHLVRVILGTEYGDVNLDGVVDAADEAIVLANQGQVGLGWAGGDLNGDGSVDALDLAFFAPPTVCPGDANGDGAVNFADISPFIAAIKAGSAANWTCNLAAGFGPYLNSDANGDGVVNFADISPFIALLKNPPAPCQSLCP